MWGGPPGHVFGSGGGEECLAHPIREENSSFSHEERGILIQGIPREEIIRGKRGIDQSKIRIFKPKVEL